MRIILLVLAISFSIVSKAQVGISTNPVSPVNPEGGKLNRFDWRNLLYTINSENTSNTIDAPFSQSNNSLVNHFLDNRDNEPLDGWEMIKYDMGMQDDNITPRVKVGTIFLVLYNKYRSVLRIFLEGNRSPAYNGAEIRIMFLSGEIQSSILNMGSDVIALDQFKQDSLKSVSPYNNDQGRWYYADFPMAYDPCTCFYESKLVIKTYLISKSKINLSGSLIGTIKALTDITNNTGVVNDNGLSFNAKGIYNAANKASKSYTDISKFASDQFSAIDNEGKTNSEIKAAADATKSSINFLQGAIKKNSFLKEGLKAAPYIGAALSFVDFFVGGGASGPQEVKVTPMAINTTLNLKGSLISTFEYNNITFLTPGAKNNLVRSVNDNKDYPYYNEVLGVFNLLEAPSVYQKEVIINGGFGAREFTYQVKPIRYVLNPAAGFKINKVEILAGLEFPGLTTRFMPLSCMPSFSYFIQGSLPPVPPPTKLKLLINLERNDTNEDTQNALLVMSFPINRIEPPTGFVFGRSYSAFPDNIVLQNTIVIGTYSAWKNITIGSNVTFQAGSQLIAGENIIVLAGAAIPANVTTTVALPIGCSASYAAPAIADFAYCNSSTYNNPSRALRRAKEDIEEKSNQKETDSFSFYPNPTSGITRITYALREPSYSKMSVLNLSGQIVATPLDEFMEAGTHQLEFDVSGLPAGMYIIKFESDKLSKAEKLVVIK
jgi:Secretion system C-terminal sorting domain